MRQIKIFKSNHPDELETRVNNWLKNQSSEVVKIHSISLSIDANSNACFPYFCLINYELYDVVTDLSC